MHLGMIKKFMHIYKQVFIGVSLSEPQYSQEWYVCQVHKNLPNKCDHMLEIRGSSLISAQYQWKSVPGRLECVVPIGRIHELLVIFHLIFYKPVHVIGLYLAVWLMVALLFLSYV